MDGKAGGAVADSFFVISASGPTMELGAIGATDAAAAVELPGHRRQHPGSTTALSGALIRFAVVTRARIAGRRDADRSARSARAVQRLLAARFDGEVAGGADSF